MPLSIGDRLGPYEILAPIGAGGMGDVWKARDTRLDRIVAIKVSKEQFSERFEREARAVAALNHSNICTLHDVGPNYLVMEYIEGAPLKGPLPLDQALKYAVQICDALDAAHRKGITHRDLKPGNILASKAGIKLLDFGLAKVGSAGMGQGSQPGDATLTMALTGKNEIVGTLYYMSPEQLQAQGNGQEIDGRSDIFSFGLVFYEMLTGKRAFAGTSPASVIAAIMERPAPSIADVAPAGLDRLLKRCLAKDPDDRWQSARDLKAELEWITSAPESGDPAATPPANSRVVGWRVVGMLASLAVAMAALASWAFFRTPSMEPKPVSRWTMPLDIPVTSLVSGFINEAEVALSHDGTLLAYRHRGQIWVRRLDEMEGKPVPGTEGGIRPTFSPDGQFLVYLSARTAGLLQRIPVSGGSPTVLCKDATYYGKSWGTDGTILFAGSAGLVRVAAAGGACEPVTTANEERGEAHRWPTLLPDGQTVIFSVGTRGDFSRAHLAVLDLKSRKVQILENAGSAISYAPSGHLLYARAGNLFAVPFDLKRLAVAGPEVQVAERLFYNPTGGFADYSFSDSGLFLYSVEVRSTGHGMLSWMDRKGNTQPLAVPPHNYDWLRMSPDGKLAVAEVRDSFGTFGDIWIYDLERGSLNRLTSGNTSSIAAWTPDSKRVAFHSSPSGSAGIYSQAADGAGIPDLLLASPRIPIPTSWTPDGKTLLYQLGDPTATWALTPGTEPRQVSRSLFKEEFAAVSADGLWMAYDSDESGINQVYAKPISGQGSRMAISIAGGEKPRWSGDGRELFYRDPVKNQLMAVDVQPGTLMKAGQPKMLFPLGDVAWDVAPDGRRFLVVQRQGDEPTAKLQVVVNFFEELRRKVPTGK